MNTVKQTVQAIREDPWKFVAQAAAGIAATVAVAAVCVTGIGCAILAGAVAGAMSAGAGYMTDVAQGEQDFSWSGLGSTMVEGGLDGALSAGMDRLTGGTRKLVGGGTGARVAKGGNRGGRTDVDQPSRRAAHDSGSSGKSSEASRAGSSDGGYEGRHSASGESGSGRTLSSKNGKKARERRQREEAAAASSTGSDWWGYERTGSGGATRLKVDYRSDNEVVLHGHGDWPKGNGTLVVPEGTSIAFYGPHDFTIDELEGMVIAGKNGANHSPIEVHGPGSVIPNYTLSPLGPGFRFIDGATVVDGPTRLSDLLKENMGRVHWAACRGHRDPPRERVR